MLISKRAKVLSDKPAYTKKEKTDSGGYVWRYDEKHIEKRWKEKKDKLKRLEKGLEKVRSKYHDDLKSDDDRTRAIAAIVGIMDETAMRIGNEDSAKEGTFGASTLKVKHVKDGGSKITFDFPGKGAVEQNVEVKDKAVMKAIRDLMKGKKADDFIFEVDGGKIWDRAVNRYLNPFEISAKDLRGFHANRLMKEMLKKKDFNEALKEVAEIVGHKASTLKNQYLDPELVEKNEGKNKKASISIRAEHYQQVQQTQLGGPELYSMPAEQYFKDMYEPITQAPGQAVDLNRNVSNIDTKISPRGYEQVKLTPQVVEAWKILAPFLPQGATLSSGYRSEQDQATTIKNHWYRSWNGYFAKNFPQYGRTVADMQRFMNSMYDPRKPGTPPGGPSRRAAMIAAPGESRHQSSSAMDIQGINYRLAERIIYWLNKNMGAYVNFTPLREGDHIHVSVNKAINPGPENLTRMLRKYYYGAKVPQMYVSQSYDPLMSKEAALDRDDLNYFRSKMRSFFGSSAGGLNIQQKQQLGIAPGARVDNTILGAWRLLQPYLPVGAKLTSGVRTPEEQTSIIEQAWRRYNASSKYPNVTDPTEMAKILTQEYGFVVGSPDQSKRPSSWPSHLKGTSFDVSGANLEDIANAVHRVSRDPSIPVKLTAKVEDENNAVHVNIYELGTVAGDSFDRMTKMAIYEDLVESEAPDEVLVAFDPKEDGDHRGMGLPDMMGDWFEKSPIFRHRTEAPEYAIHEDSADKLAKDDPETFFYRGMHKESPELEVVALKNMIKGNAKFYFIFDYHTREEDEFKELLQEAAEALSRQDARAFFYFHLHHEFPELGRGAIVQLVDTNPDSFFDLGLDKDYPDYVGSANNARNIKDPNKVELEQPEWLIVDDKMPLSLRNKAALLTLSKRAGGLGPIAPMKLRKLSKPDDILKNHDDSDIIVQQKIDGFKTQAIKHSDGTVMLHTRRGENFEANVPSLATDLKSKMSIGDFWLGELAYVKNGKQSISDIQTVVGSGPEKAQQKLKSGDGHLVFYVYDLLWDHGKDITKEPYTERYAKLQKKVGKSKLVEIVKNYSYSDKDKAINDALAAGGEGIVLKPKRSVYKYGPKGSNEPHGEWAKFKPGAKSHTDEVILNKYTKGEEKLKFPMYQYKGSELFEVGQLSGMSKEDEAKIKKDIDAGKQVVVEVTFQERMPSGKFRHVGWSRFRPDKSAKEVKFSKASSMIGLSKRAAREDNFNISDSEIRKIYELEYKLYELGKREYLGDNANVLKLRYEDELRTILDKALKRLNTQFTIVRMQWQNDAGIIGNNEALEYIYPEAKQLSALQKEIKDYLAGEKIQPQPLGRGIELFNRALQATHSQGLVSLDYLPVERSKNVENKPGTLGWMEKADLFNELSEGKDVPEWQSQIDRISSRSLSISKRADVISFPADFNEADDGGSKYEKEKDDKKWDEVLIDSERKWTRREIRNHYLKHAGQILKQVKGKPVMLYIGTGKNQNILKRNDDKGKQIVINGKEDLMYWADRRMTSIHLVMGTKTNLGWVDLDLHGYPFEKAVSYAHALAPALKKKFGVTPEIWKSGGTGLHMELKLGKEWDIDKLRHELKTILDEFDKKYPEVTTGLAKGKYKMRADVSTLHNKGNLRAEWAIGESKGNVKQPLGK